MFGSGQDLPVYAALRDRPGAPDGSAWGLFGAADTLGTANFAGAAQAAAATRLVRTGEVFSLDYEINTFVPSIAGTRPATRHRVFANNPNHRDDWLDDFYLQSTSQIDGLRHMRHPVHGFYNGTPDAAIVEGSDALGIQELAEHGLVTRGVLLDMPEYFRRTGREYDPLGRVEFSARDFEGAAALAGIEPRAGDVLLLYTAWAESYLGVSEAERAAIRASFRSPGIAQTREMAAYLWDSRAAMLASDNSGIEVFPVLPTSDFWDPDAPTPDKGPNHNGMIHRPLIALLGLYLGELWRLDRLAAACRRQARHEFLLVAKPLAVPGGVGSPPNALAVF